jgi:hypothetical protein
MPFHLAEVNIARLLQPLDHEQLADFVANLGPVNARAEEAPGYVWRLKDDVTDDATSIEAFRWDTADSAGVIVNLSVWVDLQHLLEFVYEPTHREVLSRRREWFHQVRDATTACWWVQAGHEPSPEEAEDRVLHLRAHGPTPYAFTLREHFPAPAEGQTYLPVSVPASAEAEAEAEQSDGATQLC